MAYEKILFICYANIARSQMAEAFYNYYTKTNNAISAGIADFGEKYHHVPHKGVIEVMLEKNITMSQHKVKTVTPKMSKKVHKIIVFCEIDKCPEFIKDNPKTIHMPLKDPGANINGPNDYSKEIIQGLRNSREEIETVVKEIVYSQVNKSSFSH